MPNILKFSRNRHTSVEQIDDHTLKSCCRLQDTLMDAHVEILVRLPDLEIVAIDGEVRRAEKDGCASPVGALQNVLGVRVGPGMLKIIKGLVGGEDAGCRQLAFMVEECCHGVILAFTKQQLLAAPKPTSPQEAREFFAKMVRDNIRLYNRCAAFSTGSALVEGIDPPR
jgi:hypothetical protein